MVCDDAVCSCSLYPQIRELWILSHPIPIFLLLLNIDIQTVKAALGTFALEKIIFGTGDNGNIY